MSDRLDPLDAVNELYTDPNPVIDFVKLQVAFWEKLVVLDAAILAASFTAATGIFHDYPASDGGVRYLLAAWKLLFWGLGLCLLAQWIAIPGAIAASTHKSAMRVLSLLNKSAVETTAQGQPLSPEYRITSTAIVSEAPKLRLRANALFRIAGLVGSTGLLASIAALYWLYRFAQVNVARAGH